MKVEEAQVLAAGKVEVEALKELRDMWLEDPSMSFEQSKRARLSQTFPTNRCTHACQYHPMEHGVQYQALGLC